MEVKWFDLSEHHVLRNIKIRTPVGFNPEWFQAAVSSIPESSSVIPRDPPLRIELHVSFPLVDQVTWGRKEIPWWDSFSRVVAVAAFWTPLDMELWRLIEPRPYASGITVDVNVTNASISPRDRSAMLMFPLMSSTKRSFRLARG